MNVFGEFMDISNLYRYKLRIIYRDQELIIGRSVLISALHKTERRRKSGIRLLFILAFYDAISKLDKISVTKVQASLTFFLNRFAICVFEEGSILHADKNTQQEIINLLVTARIASDCNNWGLAAESLCKIVQIANDVPRGRFVCIFTALAKISDKLEYEDREFLKLFDEKVLYDIKYSNTVKSKKILINAVKGLCPEFLPILEQKKYLNCGELRKNMYVIVYLSTVTSKINLVMENNGRVDIENTTIKDLKDMGVFDCHVKKSVEHDKVFEKTGSLIAKEVYSPICVLGYAYEDLEEFYQKNQT